jgi:organic hydroperoxide reductase OsmC/OhrA
MKPLPHHYTVLLAGSTEGYAALTSAGLPNLASAPPLEFGGPGDAWSPEQLLLAAVGSCFHFSLRAIAQASRLEFISLELAIAGTVDRRDGELRFTEILLRPRLVIPEGGDPERARRVLERAKKTCLVSSSLSTSLRVEPEIATE